MGVSHAQQISGEGGGAWAKASPEFFGPPTDSHAARETATEFRTVIKLDVRKFVCIIDHNLHN